MTAKCKKRIRWLSYLKDLPGIMLGSLILAVAMNMFLIPHQLAAGGFSGLGVIFYHLIGLPVGLTVI
ncbi:MAG TPA: YitT family protein, partial [Bacillota bacterium]|nr:YitT family protein [Bacillota bacterium]